MSFHIGARLPIVSPSPVGTAKICCCGEAAGLVRRPRERFALAASGRTGRSLADSAYAVARNHRWLQCWTAAPGADHVLFLCHWPFCSHRFAQFPSRALGRDASFGDVFRHLLTFSHVMLDRVFFLLKRIDRFDVDIVGLEILQHVHCRRPWVHPRRRASRWFSRSCARLAGIRQCRCAP